MVRGVQLCGLAALVPVVAVNANAQVDDVTYDARRGINDDRFALSLGGFLTQFSSESRLDSEALGEGTNIDLENVLGLDKQKTALRLDGYYRFSRNSRLQFGYTQWNRAGERRISEEIQWGDQVDTVDALVAMETKNNLLKLAYMHSFVNDGRIDAGASLGLSTYWFRNTIFVAAGVTGGGGGVSGEAQHESRNVVAPIPHAGAPPRLDDRAEMVLPDLDRVLLGPREWVQRAAPRCHRRIRLLRDTWGRAGRRLQLREHQAPWWRSCQVPVALRVRRPVRLPAVFDVNQSRNGTERGRAT